MNQNFDTAISYSSQWLDIIKQETFPEESQAKWIIEESKTNFAEHFNRGWLEYRKSVTEAGDWASVEWSGKGSTFTDVMGRKYIDWLGGFGMMDLGWCHPEIVEAVIAQVKRSPMPSQELIDPLRGVLAKLMAEITPGDLKYSWFAASGTEAIEASIKIAKLYTGKSAFIVALKGFHGKTMGSLSMMGKADYRQPLGTLYGGQIYHVPFGDADAVEKQLEICEKVGIGVAGVLFEPIQGEAGAIVPPDDFWPRVRAALACAAAIASINITLRDRLWESAATKGSYLKEKVDELAVEFPQVYQKVTGKGLLIGQHFQTPELGYKVAAELFKRGVLVAGTLTSAQTIRIEPPLIISQEEIDEGLNRLNDAVGAVAKMM
jgi:acetylornithine/succinyldiaminopimelate/putrescine aminotransferase